MMTTRAEFVATLWVVAMLAISLVIGLAFADRARAQGRVDAAFDLARLGAHEAGLQCSSDELAAIYSVARNRCSRCSPSTALRTVSRRFFAGRTTRSYYLWLRRDGSAPWLWPSTASWTRWRDRWLALLASADSVVRGERSHACELDPQAWGGAADAERARRLRLIEVQCGETANRFYRYPGAR
jgi:hypothetical protein